MIPPDICLIERAWGLRWEAVAQVRCDDEHEAMRQWRAQPHDYTPFGLRARIAGLNRTDGSNPWVYENGEPGVTMRTEDGRLVRPAQVVEGVGGLTVMPSTVDPK